MLTPKLMRDEPRPRSLQRRCSCGGIIGPEGECAACKAKRLQRQQTGAAGGPVHAQDLVRGALRSPGRPLDSVTRTFMEQRFEHDFSRVRVHTDERAAESARAVNAVAYTVGGDVVFAPGRYAPETARGRELLAHELTHVVQQRGRGGDAPVIAPQAAFDPSEREADAAARAVAAGTSVAVAAASAPGAVQRQEEELTQAWRAGPIDALQARSDAQTALRDTRATRLPGLHNGPADAWRHCYWSCLMTHSIGAQQARTVADTHEEFGGNPANELTMDLHNNAEGRACGAGVPDCATCCHGKLTGGGLLIIPDWSGRAVLPPVSSTAGAVAPPVSPPPPARPAAPAPARATPPRRSP